MRGLFSGVAVSAAANAAASRAEWKAQSASSAVHEMEVKNLNAAVDINKLFLITQALWELLKKERGYKDEVLMQKVMEIDLSSGRLDGKAPKGERADCSSCGKKMGRHPTCIYCGTVNVRSPFER